MKLLSTLILVCLPVLSWSQKYSADTSKLQIKIEPFEFVYNYPRMGIGLEKKLDKISLWSMVHYGWKGIEIRYIRNHFDDDYYYLAAELGLKRRTTDSSGEFYYGGRISYDRSGAMIFDNVYYHLANNNAVLFDRAKFSRTRINLFLETGHEFYIGRWFSIELYGGFGVRRIEISYKNVENPIILSDIEPVDHRLKLQYEYASGFFKPALIGGIRFGYTL